MNIAVLGLSVTSSWGNGHATTYRALLRALAARGHRITFFERDQPWYADNRDLPDPPYCRAVLYNSISDLQHTHDEALRSADVVVVGSYVPDGAAVIDLVLRRCTTSVTAFYDIDTPVTLARLAQGDAEYLRVDQIPRLHLYLSFTGGPTLQRLMDQYGAPLARPLYCSVDPHDYYPEPSATAPAWDLGYLGTYSDDRQPVLDALLLAAARRDPTRHFVIAGAQYPDTIAWPSNVQRIAHLAPPRHRAFYNRLRFTLNVTRRDMVRAGYSPSVRLFEAAACGTPIISDTWSGLDGFFTPGSEILLARTTDDTLRHLRDLTDEARLRLGAAARRRVLAEHTAQHRAIEFETHARDAAGRSATDAPSRVSITPDFSR
jgi:spore maturation protein CgeB